MIGTIGLGSNLGDRGAQLRRGLRALEREGVALVAVSSVWESEPVDADTSLWFLNMAVKVRTERDPRRLLTALLAIERRAGRVRAAAHAPRTLDLDLLTLGRLVVRKDDLQLPHPRMWQRRFVLEPLAEVAPELRNPATGRTAAEEAAWLRTEPAIVVRIGRLATAGRLPL